MLPRSPREAHGSDGSLAAHLAIWPGFLASALVIDVYSQHCQIERGLFEVILILVVGGVCEAREGGRAYSRFFSEMAAMALRLDPHFSLEGTRKQPQANVRKPLATVCGMN